MTFKKRGGKSKPEGSSKFGLLLKRELMKWYFDSMFAGKVKAGTKKRFI